MLVKHPCVKTTTTKNKQKHPCSNIYWTQRPTVSMARGPTLMFQGVNYIRSVKKSKDIKETDWLVIRRSMLLRQQLTFCREKKNQPTSTAWKNSIMRTYDRQSILPSSIWESPSPQSKLRESYTEQSKTDSHPELQMAWIGPQYWVPLSNQTHLL